jgi:2-polyprenyl-3-methyl-5-hydroxy-6-metoxy-1,4-benzoquinol methylase
MFQVFHHVENPIALLKEIKRVLSKDGFLFLREHDKNTDIIANIFTLEHIFYAILFDKTNYNDFINDYYEFYYSKQELISIMKEYNLIECKPQKKLKKDEYKKFSSYNPSRYYHILFQLK